MADDKKTISATQWGAIIVALIGLCGTLGAAVVAGCLGSPGVCFSANPTPTFTLTQTTIAPATDTPTLSIITITDTVTPIGPTPTSTITDTPSPTPTLTSTPTNTPTPIINGFVGTWINVYDAPPTLGLQFALSRLEITALDLNTVKVSACRCDTSACESKIRLSSQPAIASLQGNLLTLNNPPAFELADKLYWKLTVRKDNTLLLITIEEELPDGSKNSANIQMKPYNDPLGGVRNPCVSPVFTRP